MPYVGLPAPGIGALPVKIWANRALPVSDVSKPSSSAISWEYATKYASESVGVGLTGDQKAFETWRWIALRSKVACKRICQKAAGHVSLPVASNFPSLDLRAVRMCSCWSLSSPMKTIPKVGAVPTVQDCQQYLNLPEETSGDSQSLLQYVPWREVS